MGPKIAARWAGMVSGGASTFLVLRLAAELVVDPFGDLSPEVDSGAPGSERGEQGSDVSDRTSLTSVPCSAG